MLSLLRPYLLWLLATILALIIILANESPPASAIRSRSGAVTVTGSKPFARILDVVSMLDENRKLRLRLAKMSVQLADESECRFENQRLREMLVFKAKSRFELIPAEVVGICPDPVIRGLLVNAGAQDGVSVNSAVVGTSGVVGRVFRVNPTSAMIQLLLDPNMGMAGRLKKGREDGIVQAGPHGGLRFDGVPTTAKVDVGDSVLSSGIGGIFPEGLPIGVVNQVRPSLDGWLWEIDLAPAVDFERLEEVFIIREDSVDG
ncbi:MAG: rod shape-determining protein MreC [Calditrichota bacterium]